jgi:hypothetical protein
MPKLFWDIETKSTVNLYDSGAHIYASDPSTKIICLCWAVDDGDVQVWRLVVLRQKTRCLFLVNLLTQYGHLGSVLAIATIKY